MTTIQQKNVEPLINICLSVQQCHTDEHFHTVYATERARSTLILFTTNKLTHHFFSCSVFDLKPLLAHNQRDECALEVPTNYLIQPLTTELSAMLALTKFTQSLTCANICAHPSR